MSISSPISGENSGGMFFGQLIDLFPSDHHSPTHMARILSDKEIKKLIGEVIIGADERLVSPNGIELRLGTKVRFMSTNEQKTIPKGNFVVVHPGEAVLIVSIESLNFNQQAVQKYFPGCALMGIITPTTTMMREGMIQCATKVHAGYSGGLNWGFRNSSSKDFIIGQGEPMFNLTLLLLQGDEVPDVSYGENPDNKYQNTEGIVISQRRVPADIPKDHLISSSFHKLDPKLQLREAGHPFNYIGTELTQLDGKFEVVSKDVDLLGKKIDGMKTDLSEKIDSIFQNKFFWAVALFAAIISFLYGAVGFIKQNTTLTPGTIYLLAIVIGVVSPIFVWILFFRRSSDRK